MRKKDYNFEMLYNDFYNFQKEKVKITTLKTYRERIKYFEMLLNIKLKDFSMEDYINWRNYINSCDLSIVYKNQLLKLLKALLNFATKWYDLNFNSIYKKMEKFDNPNSLPKEMDFYTYDEFKLFISNESDILYKSLYEVLYYCGLRRGELKGLTWKNIDFKNKTLRVNKNVISYIDGFKYKVITPKTKSSIRTIPLPDVLIKDLMVLYGKVKVETNFSVDWFVFGTQTPISNEKIRIRKNKLCIKSNLRQIRIHDFRHSCASLLINNGASINLVAKYLGHARVEETLNTYCHLYKNEMMSIVNVINKLK